MQVCQSGALHGVGNCSAVHWCNVGGTMFLLLTLYLSEFIYDALFVLKLIFAALQNSEELLLHWLIMFGHFYINTSDATKI